MLTRSSITLPGYQLTEQLYTGSRTLVYRAVRDADQQPVVIKLLKNEHPSFSELVQFCNQYALAKNLEISGIVKPYSLNPYGNSYALIMEDFGGSSLRHFAKGRSLPLEQFWSIALQLTEILHPLHQQRVIHKDIKPANILIQLETQQVKLIDFSISSLLPRETQEIKPLNGLEGTLAYLSPEQTGRMNRGVDYRSDFYSLGVTFYELLTGRLPFQSSDPMEIVHCHLAELPLPVCTLNTDIPLMLGEIVHKLMAKNAEDRYQSALGLKHDLVTCKTQWQTTGRVSEFELGQRDLCDRFLIPEKLYGREPEVETLIKAFGRVAEGAAELMLIAGFSGIGKTAVVSEVHKPLVQQRGYFIKGKYDQFNRNIPLSAFVQALRDLMRKLLCESDEQLVHWQDRILEALGENGQVLIEVIPELERIIGKQPSAPQLSGSAAQNRFNRLFQKFIGVFTTQEHPLVLFLDDLQWADLASLNLMQVLMSQSEVSYLLLIGAYRDNEVSPAHPLMLTIAEIEKAAIVNTLTLAPLSQVDVNRLVAETLSCSASLASPLTELIYLKTEGNPFFTTQFLKALYEDGLIRFDCDAGFWQCDVSQVRSLALTDDVVEFMALQLQKLPEATQTVLKLAACIGNQFDLATLAIVSEQPETETATVLWKALQEGLVIPQSDIYKFFGNDGNGLAVEQIEDWLARTDSSVSAVIYKFLHDRVQQAAYSLIPAEQKQITHLQIGRLLQQATAEGEQDELLFGIVNHLNKGASLIEDSQEQQELVELNLAAGQKAKSATAYKAALDYFNTGIALLKHDCWQRQYALTLALYEGAVNSAYLSTDFEQMEQLASVVLIQARSWLDRVSTYEAKIQACIAQNQLLEALQLAQEVLKHLDVHLPEQPTSADIRQGLQQTQALLSGRSISSLLELPEMVAPDKQAAMVILSSIVSVAYQTATELLPLIIFTHIDLSVQYGNAPESTYGYVMYGLVLANTLEEIEASYSFGKLGISLLQRFHNPKLTAKTIFGFNNHLSHWKEPAKDTLSGCLRAYASGLDTGDFEYVALSLLCYDYTACFTGQELAALKHTMEEHGKIMQQFRQKSYFCIQSIYYQTVLNLLEPTAQPDRLCSQFYDEEAMIQLHLEANQSLALFQLYFCKMLLSYVFQRDKPALENARLAEQYIGSAAGLLHIPLFFFYKALIELAAYPAMSEAEQITLLDRVAAHQEKLGQWAVYAPANQAHRCALVAAERCRVLGQKAEAIDLYDRAILKAKENEYIQEAAIANELAAKFYLAWGKERIAQDYLIEAYYGYARWGAKAKIVDLETRYPQLLAPILQQSRSPLSVNETVFAPSLVTSTSASSSSISDTLDLAAILKASQMLSSEIELGKLLSTLLQLIIENAGADKCVLMLMRDDSLDGTRGERLFVKGLATIGTEPVVLQRIPVEESQDIPLKLIYSVKNRLEPVVLMDATTRTELITDPYFGRQQPKSILCSPILHQGKLLGIVYLENNLTVGAFTHDRVHILNLLCAQATISLENASLYEQVQQALEDAKLMQFSIDQITTPVCWVEPDARVSYANDAFCRDVGYSREEILGRYVYDFSPDFSEEGWSDHWQLIHQQGSATFESRILNREGVCHPVELTINHIVFHGQEYHLTFLVDISDRKQAEQEQARLRAILEATTDIVGIADTAGNNLYLNQAGQRLLEIPAEEMNQFHISEAIAPSCQKVMQMEILPTAMQQGIWSGENMICSRSGEEIPVSQVLMTHKNAQGEIEFISTIMRDDRDRKRAEFAILQKSQELEHALQDLQHAQLQIIQSEKMSALGNLVAGVAHEINNPIGFISGNLQPALDHVKDTFGLLDLYQQEYPHPSAVIQNEIEAIDLDYVRQDLPKLIGSMKLGVDRIRGISTSLRTFSRADKDCKVFFNIHEGIDSTILILKHRLKANSDRPEIEVDIDYGNIPIIECFPGQLNQVFMNILANAIDTLEEATQKLTFENLADNSNRIEIQTQLDDVGKQVIIHIRDNGMGMTDEVKQRVFDHLFTTKAVGKGTGLGLAIAHQIVVEKHGGAIAINSTLGVGTEFVITLPVMAKGSSGRQSG